MTHSETIRAGRARDRGASSRTEPELRWRLLDDLTAAREDWGLKDRTLQVMRALLTFLPRGEHLHLTVFPSNRTLSERLLGMPESTLRRHLAKLIGAGLIRRRASTNGKRFRIGANPDLAFGLDLTPFFSAARDLAEKARAALARRAEIAEMRMRLRLALEALPADHPAQEMRVLLRRKLPVETLRMALEMVPPKSDVDAAQNECHSDIQDISRKERREDPVALAVSEISELAGTRVETERDLERAGEQVALAHGVHGAWRMARQTYGPAWAGLVLVYLARRREAVRHPGRYLHALIGRARTGGFDLMDALAVRRGVDCSQLTDSEPAIQAV